MKDTDQLQDSIVALVDRLIQRKRQDRNLHYEIITKRRQPDLNLHRSRLRKIIHRVILNV